MFIHAGMWSFIWRDLITRLSSYFRCLALDYPGAGLTRVTVDDIDLESFVDLTTAWLDDLGIDDAVYVVHDLGGVVGINTAARRPASVRGIVADQLLRMATAHALAAGDAASDGRADGDRPPRLPTRDPAHDPQQVRCRPPLRQHRPSGRSSGHTGSVGQPAGTSTVSWARFAVRATCSNTPNPRSATSSPGRRRCWCSARRTTRSGSPTSGVHTSRTQSSRVIDGGNHFPMCDDPDIVATWISEWHRDSVGSRHSDASQG